MKKYLCKIVYFRNDYKQKYLIEFINFIIYTINNVSISLNHSIYLFNAQTLTNLNCVGIIYNLTKKL